MSMTMTMTAITALTPLWPVARATPGTGAARKPVSGGVGVWILALTLASGCEFDRFFDDVGQADAVPFDSARLDAALGRPSREGWPQACIDWADSICACYSTESPECVLAEQLVAHDQEAGLDVGLRTQLCGESQSRFTCHAPLVPATATSAALPPDPEPRGDTGD